MGIESGWSPTPEEPREEESSQDNLDVENLSEDEKQRRKEIKKNLERTIHQVLKPAGFKRDGSTWRRDVNDIIQILNIQRFAYKFEFAVNIAIFRKDADPTNTKPKEYDIGCERFRFLDNRLLDFENTELVAEERIKRAAELISNQLIPFFLAYDSTEKISGKDIRNLVTQAEEKPQES